MKNEMNLHNFMLAITCPNLYIYTWDVYVIFEIHLIITQLVFWKPYAHILLVKTWIFFGCWSKHNKSQYED
jgi:hypothetical protein